MHRGCHDDDRDTLKQLSWEEAMLKLTQSGPSWTSKKGDDDGVGVGGSMPKLMQSRCLSVEARAGFARPNNALGDESTCWCCQYRAYKVEGPNHASSLEKVSTTGCGAQKGGVEGVDATRGCRSRRSRRDETLMLATWLCWTK